MMFKVCNIGLCNLASCSIHSLQISMLTGQYMARIIFCKDCA